MQRKLGFLFLPALLTFVKANNFSSLGSKTSFCKLLLKAAILFLVPSTPFSFARRNLKKNSKNQQKTENTKRASKTNYVGWQLFQVRKFFLRKFWVILLRLLLPFFYLFIYFSEGNEAFADDDYNKAVKVLKNNYTRTLVFLTIWLLTQIFIYITWLSCSPGRTFMFFYYLPFTHTIYTLEALMSSVYCYSICEKSIA